MDILKALSGGNHIALYSFCVAVGFEGKGTAGDQTWMTDNKAESRDTEALWPKHEKSYYAAGCLASLSNAEPFGGLNDAF